jgi:hypothetical protein
MRIFLSNLLATFTGPRYFPEFEWSGSLWTHNVFRAFGAVFGERYGIRPSVASWMGSDGKQYQTAYTLEAQIALVEIWVRSLKTKLVFDFVFVPQLQVSGMPNIGVSPFMFAIATDAFSGLTNTASLSHTCTGSNLILVSFDVGDFTDTLSAYTYNSVAMTQVDKQQYPADRFMYSYYQTGPSTGANNITSTGQTYRLKAGLSYTGASQTGQPDSHAQNTVQGPSTTFTATTTVVASNCWIIALNYGGSATSDGTGTRRGAATDGCNVCDSNGTVGTGSQSVTLGQPNNLYGYQVMSIKPPATAVNSGFFRAALN